MFEAFLHQIQTELGPLYSDWFEELSARAAADGRRRSDERCEALPRDDVAVFRAPEQEMPGLDAQLSSTPKIFGNAGSATQGSIARGSPEPDLLDTPKSSLAQDASLKRISESLGAQLNPDLSWSSSFNTPSALSPTVILPKRKEQSSPGSFLRDQEVIYVRKLFPSLSKDAESTSGATLDKIEQTSERKRADTSSDSTQGFWRQTVPEAIKDDEVRNALEEVLDGAEDVLSIFFSNSNSALRRVKSNERAKKRVSVAPKAVTSALTSKSDADSTLTCSVPATDVGSLVKNNDFTQWTPFSLSEVPDSKAGQICSSDLADEEASFTCKDQVEAVQSSQACSGNVENEKCRLDAHAERLQGKNSLFEMSPALGVARKNRKFVYRVQTPCPSKRKDQNATPGGFKPMTAAALTTSEETSFIESKHEDSLAREAAVQPPNPEALRLDHGLDMTQLCKAFAEDFTQDVKSETSPKKSDEGDHGGLITSTCCGQAAKMAQIKAESEKAREDVVEFHLNPKEPMACGKSLDVNTPEMMETEESVKFADDGAVIPCDSKLYSGFKTASNKVIVVPPEAVMKAKSAFDESGEQCASGQSTLSVTEATKASHKRVLPTENHRFKRSERKPAATTPTGTSAKAFPDSFTSQTNESGFQTASTRSISVSPVYVEDLAGEKTSLNPLDLEVVFAEDPKCNGQSREEPTEKLKSNVERNSSLTASQKADVTELCSILEERDSQYEFTQFKPTKPGSKSSDSAELEREWDPDMLAGIDFDDSFNAADSGRHASRNPEARPDEVGKDSPNGFAQPKHKSCVLQETVNAKDSSTNDNLALHSEASTKEETTSFFGFKTATGNAVTVSKKCLNAAKSLFADLEDGEGNVDLKCDLRRTGSLKRGREVASTSSSKASERHIKRADDGKGRGIAATETNFAPELEVNPCNGNASLATEESGISKPICGASDLDVGWENVDQKETLSSGFCTARGKKVANFEGVSCKSEDLASPSAPSKPNAPDTLVKADPKLLESLTDYKHNTEIAERKESRCPRPTAVESSGFKMASGREVSVSASAVLKSKSIFKDLDDTSDIPNQAAFKLDDESSDLGAAGAGEACTFLCGFEMASGKRESFSQKAFTASEAFFQDCDPDACAKLSVTGDCEAAAESAVRLAQTDSLNKEVWSLNESAKTSGAILDTSGGGFTTASGKTVSVSREALQRAEAVLDETSDVLPRKVPGREWSLSTAGEKGVTASDETLQKAKCLFMRYDVEGLAPDENLFSSVKTSASLGFSTASGKGVVVSEKALKEAKRLFAGCEESAADREEVKSPFDDQIDQIVPYKPKCSTSIGAIGRSAGNQKADLSKIENLGFSTASGKGVVVSEKALKEAKSVFAGCEESYVDGADDKGHFAVPKMLKISKCPSSKCNVGRLDGRSEFMASGNPKTDLSKAGNLGFSTASGKGVVVSEKALKEAKSVFAGCDESSIGGKELQSRLNVQKTPPKNRNPSSLDGWSELMESGRPKSEFSKAGNFGFSTASGKGVVVSEKALKEAKSVFAGCDESSIGGKELQSRFDVQKTPKKPKYPSDVGRSDLMKSGNQRVDLLKEGNLGFSTASGKDLLVSEKVLEEAKSLFSGCDKSSVDGEEVRSRFDVQEMPPPKKNPSRLDGRSQLMESGHPKSDRSKMGNLGFSTASGKGVVVSEKALKEAKSLFAGCDESSVDGEEVQGRFDVQKLPIKPKYSSSKCDVGMSHGRADLMKSGNRTVDLSKAGNLGFSTASGKGVVVSEKSLKEAKSLFAGCDESSIDGEELQSPSDVHKMPKKPNYPGDVGRSAERSEFMECGNQKADLSNAGIVGFNTAGGKGVSVSTSALHVALETFQDCDPQALTVTQNETSGSQSTKIRGNSDPTNQVETPAQQSPPSRLSQEESLLLLNLNGCTVTQQKYFEQEAVACAKALLEDDLNEQSLTGNLEDVSVGESSEAKGDGGRRKRVSDEGDLAGLPPLKRRLVPEFDQISANARCAVVKSSPNATLKDRRVFKYNLKPNVTHPPRNIIDQRPTLANPCQLASPHRAVQKGRTSSRKTAAFVPPFHKSVKAETTKDAASGVAEACNVFVPPFVKKSGVTAGDQEESTGFKETSLQEEKPQIGYEEQKSATEERKKEALEERNAGAENDQEERWTQALALARDMQEMRIRKKKRQTIRPLPGSLYLTKTVGVTRVSLREAVGCQRPVCHTEKELYQRGVHGKVSEIGSENAESFRFKWDDFFRREVSVETAGVQLADGGWLVPDNRGTVGKEEFYRALCDTPRVDPKLISDTWAYNHYRWIVWKRASMERAFPEVMGSRCLTPQQVLLQLKLRYDIEVDHSRRSALKKITERDDTPAKTLVLCVCGVDFSGRGGGNSETLDPKSDQPAAVVWLTDGWYCIKGLLDAPLCAMLQKGRLRAGTKIITHGAELIGSQEACPPLEAPDALMLKISANSTRRVRWDTKLGFYKDPRPFQLPLSSLYPSGGAVGCVDVIVLRCYPIQWMEKRSGGVFVFRTERAEERAARRYNSTKQKTVELLVSKIQAQFEKEEEEQKKRRRSRRLGRRELEKLQDGEEIYEAMESDPTYVEAHLTPRQVEMVSSYRRAETDRRRAELQERVRKAIQEAEQVEGGCTVRNVTPVWKLAIADAQKRHIDSVYTLNIWRPSVELQSLLREGSRFGVYHLATSETRKRCGNANVQFTATKKTQFQRVEVSPEWSRTHFPARQLTSFRDLQNPYFSSPCGEVDIVGYIISILNRQGPAPLLYLADEKCDVISVKICSSLAELALDELLKPFALLAVSNLQLCQLSAPVPALYAGQQAVFSTNPKETHLHLATERLKAFAQACETFFSDAEKKLSSLVPPVTLPSPRTPGLTSKTRPNGRMNVTPQKQSRVFSAFTPVTKRTPRPPTNGFTPSAPSEPKDSRSVKRKRGVDFLSRIPSPPPLPPLAPPPSPSVNKTFNPPRRCQTPRPPQPPPARSRAFTRLQHEHEEDEEEEQEEEKKEEEEGEWVNDEELAMINTQALLQVKRTCS